MSRCVEGIHLWTARFMKNGALAFWFCQRCGETDRDAESIPDLLEEMPGIPEEECQVTLEGEEPIMPLRCWKLPDGSLLKDTEPASTSFYGKCIPGLPESHSYLLREAATGKVREFLPARERASGLEGHFLLTRYSVSSSKLIKYRISCRMDPDTGEVEIDEPVGVAVLFDLNPVE